MTPEELRKEASAAEAQARFLGPGPDGEWLRAKARALRHEADRLEHRLGARTELLSANRNGRRRGRRSL